MTEELTIPAQLDNLDRVMDMITRSARQCGFTDERINQIQVAAEEVFVNIVKHAYEDPGDCTISCCTDDDTLTVMFIDEGSPFDPTSAPEPDTQSDVASRPVGGMGLHLVREMMDDMSYHRQNGQNILVLRSEAAGTQETQG